MNKWFAHRKTDRPVHYGHVDINVVENGLGWEFWFWVGTRQMRGYGFQTREAAVEDAKRAVDELHIH